jgi:exodeoxyribonuclease V gamma subunit
VLHIHRGERTAVLADALGELLLTPLSDPFMTEVVAVPAKGVERWLTQRLSGVLGVGLGADGICSGIDFPSTARIVSDALAAASGVPPREDPWARPLWPLLDVIDACVNEPWCSALSAHLGEGKPGHRRGRRYASAAHLAELYRSYASHRPDMLTAWAAGTDTDGRDPLPEDLRWQAQLWRQLRDRLGPSPAERLDSSCAALRADPSLSALPPRLSVFGPTRLATDQLAVLAALGQHRDVHLWLPHPSPQLWKAVEGSKASRRRDDRTATAARHPLLRSMARDVRELQQQLPEHQDHRHHDIARPTTLLGQLQEDLLQDRTPSTSTADGTVQVHACHGPARQVEVLREVLLRQFQNDPTLEPRDVIIMCPDVETFAPLISAAFGLGSGLPHPGHALRVRLADRSLRQTNPLLDTVAVLLELAGSRVTASQVLDLASSPGVRRKFNFDDDDLERARDWVARSGVRWGLDAASRAPYGMQGVTQNTWQAGLDRILLGVTTSEDEPVALGLALPLDDVDSSDIDLAGRLAELLDRLQDVLLELRDERPVQHWLGTLSDALDSLTATSPADSWQLAQAQTELASAGEDASTCVQLADIRALLTDRLRGRPTRANFRTGNLTVCTMVPMRSVPHRIVVLLGLDDGLFPRAGSIDGDDILARNPCVGERDVRSEDRQLLLDALLAAGERLIVLHTGADPVSGARRPPAVPIGELLDVLDAMTSGSREQIVHRHPLQPYDPRSFTGPNPFSFDPISLAGARRALQPRQPPSASTRLPLLTGPVALDDLVRFVEHPVKAYLRQRLRLTLPGEDDQIEDALSATLDGLQEWAVGERMLTATLRGLARADSCRLEWLRGTLPPGPLGGRVLDKVNARVGPLVAASTGALAAPPHTVDVRLDLNGRILSGTINDVHADAVVTIGYATLSAKHRARAWVLALVLAACGHGTRAITIGRRGNRAATSTIHAPADPHAQLGELLDLYDRAMREPVPLPTKTAAAYAASRRSGVSVEQALESAQREWRNDFGGDQDDAHHRYAWGDGLALTALLTAPPLPDERWHGEPSRFGELACQLWTPLLNAEQLS